MMIQGGRRQPITFLQALKFETTSYLPTARLQDTIDHRLQAYRTAGLHRPPITSYQPTELKEYQTPNVHTVSLAFTSLVALCLSVCVYVCIVMCFLFVLLHPPPTIAEF